MITRMPGTGFWLIGMARATSSHSTTLLGPLAGMLIRVNANPVPEITLSV